MRKTPLLAAVIVPPLAILLLSLIAPETGTGGESKLPLQATSDNSSWAILECKRNPNPAGLDFVISANLWQGVNYVQSPHRYPLILKVEVFGPGDEKGTGAPVFWFRSDPFMPLKGRRTSRDFPFKIPAPPDGSPYLVRAAIQSANPIVRTRNGIRSEEPAIYSRRNIHMTVQ